VHGPVKCGPEPCEFSGFDVPLSTGQEGDQTIEVSGVFARQDDARTDPMVPLPVVLGIRPARREAVQAGDVVDRDSGDPFGTGLPEVLLRLGGGKPGALADGLLLDEGIQKAIHEVRGAVLELEGLARSLDELDAVAFANPLDGTRAYVLHTREVA